MQVSTGLGGKGCLVGGGQAEGMGKMGGEGLEGGLDKGRFLKRDGVWLLEKRSGRNVWQGDKGGGS